MSLEEQLLDVLHELEYIKLQVAGLQQIPIEQRNDSFYELISFYAARWDELKVSQAKLHKQLPTRNRFLAWIATKF